MECTTSVSCFDAMTIPGTWISDRGCDVDVDVNADVDMDVDVDVDVDADGGVDVDVGVVVSDVDLFSPNRAMLLASRLRLCAQSNPQI